MPAMPRPAVLWSLALAIALSGPGWSIAQPAAPPVADESKQTETAEPAAELAGPQLTNPADAPETSVATRAEAPETDVKKEVTEKKPPTEPAAKEAEVIVLRDWLVLPRVGQYDRSITTLDPIDAELVSGEWKAPQAGDEVTAANGRSVKWQAFQAEDDGAVRGPEAKGGYAFATIDSPVERVMLLEAKRHASAMVNGEWFTGDPYGRGWLRLPVLLKQGKNELLFHMAQPGFAARLVEPKTDAVLLVEDATLPDVVAGDNHELWAALPVINATNQPLVGAALRLSIGDGEPTINPLPTIPPLSVYKPAVKFQPPSESDADELSLKVALVVQQQEGEGEQQELASAELVNAELAIRRVEQDQPQVRTFVSRIDGSVQPYTVVPAVNLSAAPAEEPPGIILALHGAGVEHSKHAATYQPKDWAHVVAPQNRRAYGFDWEDWGAIDAMEALADAQSRYPHDPKKTYVTGHSMGGHGAWRLGVLHADRFAAVGPSAGWLSLWTYGGRMPAYEDPTRIEQMLLRAASPYDTMKMSRNLAATGVYVLHGDQDNQVGVSQARFMRARLGEFHPDFAYFERRGAGHWWGDACCDWPPMMEFFRAPLDPRAGRRQADRLLHA